MLLESLMENHSGYGREEIILDFLKKELKKADIPYSIDSLGNLTAHHVGVVGEKKILLRAKLMEDCLIVSKINDDGTITAVSHGKRKACAWDGKRVVVNECKGVSYLVDGDLNVDIGLSFSEKTEKFVRIGDCITADHVRAMIGENYYFANTSENHVCCGLLLELVKAGLPYDFYIGFEGLEYGSMSAGSPLVRRLSPDLVVSLSGVDVCDFPGGNGVRPQLRLGAGPAIRLAEDTAIYDKNLLSKIIRRAQKRKIPFQINDIDEGRRTEYEAILKEGAAVLQLSIPYRYADSVGSLISMSDVENMEKIICEIFEESEAEEI